MTGEPLAAKVEEPRPTKEGFVTPDNAMAMEADAKVPVTVADPPAGSKLDSCDAMVAAAVEADMKAVVEPL